MSRSMTIVKWVGYDIKKQVIYIHAYSMASGHYLKTYNAEDQRLDAWILEKNEWLTAGDVRVLAKKPGMLTILKYG